jgi:hypothetical protein
MALSFLQRIAGGEMIKALITLMALVVFCTTAHAEKAHDRDDQNL